MRQAACFLVYLQIGLLGCLLPAGVQAQTSADGKAGADQANPEMEIRDVVERFVTAYNAHDAAAVAELFLPQAQVVDEDDNTVQGRVEIQELFAGVFEQHPDTGIEVHIESIRFIGTSLAIEMGSTVTIPPAGETAVAGRYSVLHVRNDGKWSMGLVRDMPLEPTHRDHLQALAWLTGDWVDESREGVVQTSCRWADDDSFLLQEITVRQAGQDVLKASQRIGWDPLGKRFKSWVFDSEGGYGESNWTPTETGWLIRATGVNTDGTTASPTHHIEPTGIDRYVFRSVDRVSGNEMLPPVQVTVVRRPPPVQDSDTSAAEE